MSFGCTKSQSKNEIIGESMKKFFMILFSFLFISSALVGGSLLLSGCDSSNVSESLPEDSTKNPTEEPNDSSSDPSDDDNDNPDENFGGGGNSPSDNLEDEQGDDEQVVIPNANGHYLVRNARSTTNTISSNYYDSNSSLPPWDTNTGTGHGDPNVGSWNVNDVTVGRQVYSNNSNLIQQDYTVFYGNTGDLIVLTISSVASGYDFNGWWYCVWQEDSDGGYWEYSRISTSESYRWSAPSWWGAYNSSDADYYCIYPVFNMTPTLSITYSSISQMSNSTNFSITATSGLVSLQTVTIGNTVTVTNIDFVSTIRVTFRLSNDATYDYYMRIGSAPTTTNYTKLFASGSDTYVYTWQSTGSVNMVVYIYQRYTITYNGNSNTSGTVPSTAYKIHGTAITLATNNLTRTGYTANGWNTSTSGSGTHFNSGASYTTNASDTLYAEWEPRTYTNYYRYRNSSGTTTSSSQSRTYGQAFTTLSSSALSYYTSNGWSLYGWAYDSSTSTTRTYAANTSVTSTTYTNSTSNLSWYAISQRTVSITYDANGGSSAPSSTTGTQRWNQYGTTRTTVSLTVTSTEPTRTGYTFLGWATGSTATSASYDSGDTYSFSNAYNASASVTLYAVWQASNPAYYEEDGDYWYIENGYMPQSRVSSSLHTTLESQWSSLANGNTYSMGAISGLTSKVYNGSEYCKYNNEYYLVEPIRWRLDYSSSQRSGYSTTTDTLAVMDTIVYVGRYSTGAINAGSGYSSAAVDIFDDNRVNNTYLVSWTQSMPTFGTTSLNGTPTSVTARIFVSSIEEIEQVAGSGAVKFSDLVSDFLKRTGNDLLYYTRNLGANYNNIICLNGNGDRTQRKPNLTVNQLGVQFTIKVTEYACV